MARALFQAVADNDVWQETNGETCEYLQEVFGLSDPIGCVTDAIRRAEDQGLVWLPPGRPGARSWELTHAGREQLRFMERLGAGTGQKDSSIHN